MTLFGALKAFDETTGLGTIRPEVGKLELHFDRTAVTWGNAASLTMNHRLIYEIGLNKKGNACAINIQPA